MSLPAVANIVVMAVKSLPGGEKEAQRMLASVPGSQLGRCEKCFTKVLLAPSTIAQKKQYPGHRLRCNECMAKEPPPLVVAMTNVALEDRVTMELNRKGEH